LSCIIIIFDLKLFSEFDVSYSHTLFACRIRFVTSLNAEDKFLAYFRFEKNHLANFINFDLL